MNSQLHRGQTRTIRPSISRGVQSVVVLVVLAATPATAKTASSTVETLADEFLSMAHHSLSTAAESGLQTAWLIKPIRVAGQGKESRFTSTLSGLLANRLSKRAYRRLPIQLRSEQPLAREEYIRAARKQGAEQLLIVDVFEQRNHIHLVGELVGVRVSFWSGIRHPVAGIRNHFYASARLDAELRALLDMAVSTAHTRQFEFRPLVTGLPRRRVFSAAAGDLDGDGLSELVRLTSIGLDVVRIVGASAGEPMASFSTAELSPAAIRLREQFGTMFVVDLNGDGRSEVVFWRSDLKNGHVLRLDGDTLRPLTRIRSSSGCSETQAVGSEVRLCGIPLATRISSKGPVVLLGQLEPGTNHFMPEYSSWTLYKQGSAKASQGLHWSMSTASIKQPEIGKFQHLLATVDRSGTARIQGNSNTWVVPNAGTALTFVDMNDDGQAEFVRSSKAFIGQRDEVALYALEPSGRVKRLWRKRRAIVDAICSADADNDGFNDVLVVSGRKVHLLSERR